jgi:hypothetical protein
VCLELTIRVLMQLSSFLVVTMAKIYTVLWVVTLYSPVGRYQHSRETYRLDLRGTSGPTWEVVDCTK